MFLLCGYSHAEFTQFDFSLDEYIISNENYFKVNFKYLISGYDESDFLVRPIIGNGIIEILNDDKEWISSYDYLFNLPSLKESVRVKVKGLESDKSYLYFEIYNTKNGEIYQTPKKDIWTNSVYSKYLEKFNLNLSGIEFLEDALTESTESIDLAVLESEPGENFKENINNIPKTYFLFLGLGIFVVSVATGIKLSLSSKDNRSPSLYVKKDNT